MRLILSPKFDKKIIVWLNIFVVRTYHRRLEGGEKAMNKARVGVFSVVQGKRDSLRKLGTSAANTKCAGECTCKCCK